MYRSAKDLSLDHVSCFCRWVADLLHTIAIDQLWSFFSMNTSLFVMEDNNFDSLFLFLFVKKIPHKSLRTWIDSIDSAEYAN